MKTISLKTAEIICFFIASALGVLFHFVYEWSGNNPFLAPFFPVNESTWEHLKLVFYPITIVSLVEYFFLAKKPANYAFTKLISILLGMLSVVVCFYTYTGIIGKSIDFINILIYFLSMIVAYVFSYKSLTGKSFQNISPYVGIFGILVLYLLFTIFTKNPPDLALFKAP